MIYYYISIYRWYTQQQQNRYVAETHSSSKTRSNSNECVIYLSCFPFTLFFLDCSYIVVWIIWGLASPYRFSTVNVFIFFDAVRNDMGISGALNRFAHRFLCNKCPFSPPPTQDWCTFPKWVSTELINRRMWCRSEIRWEEYFHAHLCSSFDSFGGGIMFIVSISYTIIINVR